MRGTPYGPSNARTSQSALFHPAQLRIIALRCQGKRNVNHIAGERVSPNQALFSAAPFSYELSCWRSRRMARPVFAAFAALEPGVF